MTPEAQKEEAIFHTACELATQVERSAYLGRVCGDNHALMNRIEAMLEAEGAAIEFFKPLTIIKKSNAASDAQDLTKGDRLLFEVPGTVIGRYKIREKIGEGGCGVVYVAEQLEPVRRNVALKIIKLGMDTKGVLNRFEAERQALAMMDHSNIAKVFDAGTTESGRPYFVMELVQGLPITDYCNENRLETPLRLELFIKVCQAVQHAHQKGVIHRDLKPSNILIETKDGAPVPKVIDFGIAKAVEGRLSPGTIHTELYQLIGTPAYMSPEQADMSSLDIDTRSDIYSLGVLLYELITGATPFDTKELLGLGLDSIRRTIKEQEPSRPSTKLRSMAAKEMNTLAQSHASEPPKLIKYVRGDLDWIVMKALEKNRKHRYDTAIGFGADVQRLLDNEEVKARPPSNFYRMQKFFLRHRFVVIAALAVGMTLIAGVSVSSWQLIRTRRAEQAMGEALEVAKSERQKEIEATQIARKQELVARQNSYAADMSSAFQAVKEGNLGFARKLLSGYVETNDESDLRGFEWRYLWRLSQGDQVRTLSGHSNFVNSVAFSPDGKVLASGSSDNSVKLWNPESGELMATCRGHSSDVVSVAFSSDGVLLASGSQDGTACLWDVSTKKIVLTITNPTPRVAFAGSILSLATGGSRWGFDGGMVKLWDYVANREIRSFPESGNRAAISPDGKTVATANWNGLVKLWEVASGRLLRSFPSKLVRSMHFSNDSRKLAWCASEGDVFVWDLAQEKPSILVKGVGELVYDIAFSPDRETLAVAEQNYDISLWNIDQSKESGRLRGHAGQVYALAFSPDGRILASGSRDETVMLWHPKSATQSDIITNASLKHWNGTGHPVFSSDGRLIAAEAVSGGIQIWNLSTSQPLIQLRTDALPIGLANEGRTLLTLQNKTKSLLEWHLETAKPISELVLSNVLIGGLFSPDGKLFAQATNDLELNILSGVTGEYLYSLPESGRVRSLHFSPDSRFLAVVDYQGKARVWEVQSRQCVWTAEFRDGVEGFAFSSDGLMFAAGSWDGSIHICDARSGKELQTLTGHRAGVTRLAFTRDGRTLASSGDDSVVRLWNLATGRELFRYSSRDTVHFLDFSPDDSALVVGTADNVLSLYRAPAPDRIEQKTNPAAVRK